MKCGEVNQHLDNVIEIWGGKKSDSSGGMLLYSYNLECIKYNKSRSTITCGGLWWGSSLPLSLYPSLPLSSLPLLYLVHIVTTWESWDTVWYWATKWPWIEVDGDVSLHERPKSVHLSSPTSQHDPKPPSSSPRQSRPNQKLTWLWIFVDSA